MKLLPLLKLRPPLPRIRTSSRGSRRVVAKRAVLAGVVLVIAAHLGLAALVETRKPQWRDPEFYHRQKRLAVIQRWIDEKHPGTPVIAIIGGSRPQMGLSPEVINQELGMDPPPATAFNCSQSGALPIGVMLNFKRLLDRGRAPEFVLLEVLPPVLADAGPMEDRIPCERYSARDFAHLRPYLVDPDRFELRRERARLASWSTLRMPLRSAMGLETAFPTDPASPHHLWTGMTFNGWGPFSPPEWPGSVRTAKMAFQQQSFGWLMHDFAVRPVNDRIYRDVLDECRRRGIRAALFSMPESPEFRKLYPPGVPETVDRHMRGLAREYGVPFFNCTDWVAKEEAYLDGHHLEGRAAIKFTERFTHECVAPWLGAKP